MFELLEHTADVGIRVRAATLPRLFVDAAQGLFSLIAANRDAVRRARTCSFELEADDLGDPLFDWLGALRRECDATRTVFPESEVAIEGMRLRGAARGEAIDPQRHDLEHEVKAVTCHGLHVRPTADGWEAEVIVDI